MQQMNITLPNSGAFVWSLDAAQIAAAIPTIAFCVFRMQVKTNTTDAAALIEFATGHAPASITYDPGTCTVQILAPQSLVASIVGLKYYDIRLEVPNEGEIVLASGTATFTAGPTQAASAANSIVSGLLPDTVVVTLNQAVASVNFQPLSASALNPSVTAAAASATAAANSAGTAAAIANTTWGFFPTRATAAAINLGGAGMTAIEVGGLSLAGDGPRALYVRVGSTPSHPGYFNDAGGYHWAISEPIIYPQQIGTTGASDDSATLHNADLVAVALGADLAISQHHSITNAITFASTPLFKAAGRLRPSAFGQVTLLAGFVAAPHSFIFDFSLIAATGGSGLATAKVTADRLTPQMFGAIEGSPSSSAANAITMQKMLNASAVSQMDVYLPPVMFHVGDQLVMDYGAFTRSMTSADGNSYISSQIPNMYGTAASIINFDVGVTSPNLKFTDLTGPYFGPGLAPGAGTPGVVDNQGPTFYGKHDGFQVWGTPYIAGGTSTVGGITLQYGENNYFSNSNTWVYFNGFRMDGVVIKNNAANGGGYGVVFNGMTTCDLNFTSNAGGSYYDGSAAAVFNSAAIIRLNAAVGNANYGLWFPNVSASGSNAYSIHATGMDIEVCKIGIGNRNPYMTNSYFQGTFAGIDYCIDSTAYESSSILGNGNVIGPSKIGGLNVSLFANPAGGYGSWGGAGWTFRMPSFNPIGYTNPIGNGIVLPVYSPPVMTSGAWTRNIWGVDALVHMFGASDLNVSVRQYWDGSSAGVRVINSTANGIPVLVRAGEAIQAVSSSAFSGVWRSAS